MTESWNFTPPILMHMALTWPTLRPILEIGKNYSKEAWQKAQNYHKITASNSGKYGQVFIQVAHFIALTLLRTLWKFHIIISKSFSETLFLAFKIMKIRKSWKIKFKVHGKHLNQFSGLWIHLKGSSLVLWSLICFQSVRISFLPISQLFMMLSGRFPTLSSRVANPVTF